MVSRMIVAVILDITGRGIRFISSKYEINLVNGYLWRLDQFVELRGYTDEVPK